VTTKRVVIIIKACLCSGMRARSLRLRFLLSDSEFVVDSNKKKRGFCGGYHLLAESSNPTPGAKNRRLSTCTLT